MQLSRRQFAATAAAPAILSLLNCKGERVKRPNLLFAISDDQSFPHTGRTGDNIVKTPAFDGVAERGVMFQNAICSSPGCAPSRAAILTGQGPWRLREAGTHASYFPRDLQVFPELLEKSGYFAGLTGKGAGPAKFDGWEHNPAGREWNRRRAANTRQGISGIDYAANFEDFLRARPADRPFCFWYGGQEPHREFSKGAGRAAGKRMDIARVPGFLPDCEEVRGDILDYYQEIEHFDAHLGRMLGAIKRAGESENTLVVVTSDNGMAFPRAKANMYEYGIHLPLAIMWPGQFPGLRRVDDLVSFTDFAPTFLEVAGVAAPPEITGRSLVNVLRESNSGTVDASRASALSGRERHSHARRDNLGYPARSIRTRQHLYIHNFAPDRYPAGDPEGYFDIDASPTKSWMLENRDKPEVKPLFDAAFGKYPAEQLYDVIADPACLHNLAGVSEHAELQTSLAKELESALRAQGDPRVLGDGDVFESYPRHSPMRPQLGGFAEQGAYNPAFQSR